MKTWFVQILESNTHEWSGIEAETEAEAIAYAKENWHEGQMVDNECDSAYADEESDEEKDPSEYEEMTLEKYTEIVDKADREYEERQKEQTNG